MTRCRRRLNVALVALIIATGHRRQPSAVKPAPTCCTRRLDVACVRLFIAAGYRTQPSAVKPAPTCCGRRLDVAFVRLIIVNGYRTQPSAVEPAPTGRNRRRRRAFESRRNTDAEWGIRVGRGSPQSGASIPMAQLAAPRACSSVVSNSGTVASAVPTSIVISVQPRMIASAPRATSFAMTSR